MRQRLADQTAASPWRSLLLAPLLCMLLVGMTACGGDDGGDSAEPDPVDMGDKIAGVTVSGEVGTEPEVDIEGALEVDGTTTQVISAGDDDDKAVRGDQALLHLYIANGRTGEKAASTYDQGQAAPVTLADDQLFPALVEAVAGKPVGSRVAVAAVPADAYGTTGRQEIGIEADDNVLFVVDVISAQPTELLDGPSGEEAAAEEGLPGIEESGDTISGLSWSDVPEEPPADLELTTLVEGDGEPVRKGSLATMDYVGQIYRADEPFDNSYEKQPATFTVGTGQLIPGWDSALVGVKEGSRVLLSVPPDEGYGEQGNPTIKVDGDDTLVFLIDVLGVG